jgi:hypothetical protein
MQPCVFISANDKQYSFVLLEEKLSPRMWYTKLIANWLSFWLHWGLGGQKVFLFPQLDILRAQVTGAEP